MPASISGCRHNSVGALKHAFGVAVLLGATPLLAQVATGDILGNITDSTGSIVAGASIRLENVGTHEIRTFTTKGNGEYVFSSLQPGTYSLTVGAASFKASTTSNIVLLASDRVRIDSRLQPGSTNETVEVSAVETSLQTDNTTVGSTITEKTLLDAPLNGRNYIGLVTLQAGVNGGSQTSLLNGSNQTDRRLSSSVSANGQQEIFNNNLVDGLDNNDRLFGTPMLRPSVEAIAEVRTDINLYNAEVGRTGGAAINVITKSGANQFHGSAYEFFRNDITDARNFFATTGVLSHKPELRQNQFGGSLSGPIFKDRTFFFIDYEGFRRIDGNNSVFTTTVPTLAEQQTPGYLGDITNPFTGLPVANVAAASIDPTALAYFKLFPLAQPGGNWRCSRNGQQLPLQSHQLPLLKPGRRTPRPPLQRVRHSLRAVLLQQDDVLQPTFISKRERSRRGRRVAGQRLRRHRDQQRSGRLHAYLHAIVADGTSDGLHAVRSGFDHDQSGT